MNLENQKERYKSRQPNQRNGRCIDWWGHKPDAKYDGVVVGAPSGRPKAAKPDA